MKTVLVAAVAGLTLGLTSCEERPASSTPKPATPSPAAKPATPPAAVTPPPATTPSVTAPGGATGAMEAAKQGTATAAANELRDKALAALSTKYDEFKMQVATLQEKATEVPAAAKAAFDGAMSQLNSLTKNVETKLVELKNASGEAIKTVQDSIDAAWPKIQEQITAAEKALKGS
jgi:hypothetical protein